MSNAHSSAAPPASDTLPGPLPAGGSRGVLEAALRAIRDDVRATLAIVVETQGSTYAPTGTLALFCADGSQVGWLSGGCFEPETAQRSMQALQRGRIDWLDIDTLDDAALFSGSATGCRGRLRIALLPLPLVDGVGSCMDAWCNGAGTLHLTISGDGRVECGIAGTRQHWDLPVDPISISPPPATYRIAIPASPAVFVLGAGPEAGLLLPLLRSLGWRTTLAEQRPRWLAHARLADVALPLSPVAALGQLRQHHFDAALVMHHNFELDLAALTALADTDIAFVGLLGPVRRREDLLRLLSADQCAALRPRLHAPVGLALGGHGAEAIALSIAAQLQTHRTRSSNATRSVIAACA